MIKITIQVEDDIPAILTELAGGQRKIGQFITSATRALKSAEQYAGDDLAMLLLMLRTIAGQTKQIDARVANHAERITRLETTP